MKQNSVIGVAVGLAITLGVVYLVARVAGSGWSKGSK